jgi:tRNA/rRNA methyltransferase
VLHELQRRRRSPGREAAAPLASAPDPGGEPAPRGELEAALIDAEALLLEVGFLLPHTARARMAKLRALLQRAQVQPGELALLRGMVCQLRWASRRPCPPGQDH